MNTPAIDIQLLRDIIAGGLHPSDGVALVPQGYQLADLEPYADAPKSLRGVYTAASIDEFARYILGVAPRDSGSPARIFLDPEHMSATARLDHGSDLFPGWGRHRAVLKLAPTPGYEALRQIAGRELAQDQLIDYIADWPSALSFSTTSPDLPWVEMKPPAAIQAIRKLQTEARRDATHSEEDRSKERTVFERAAIVSCPPATLVWTGAPFEGLSDYTVRVRLAYAPKDPPTIRLRVVGEQQLRKQIADEFRTLVCQAIASAMPVHIGTWSASGG